MTRILNECCLHLSCVTHLLLCRRAIRGCFRMTLLIVHTFMDITVLLNCFLGQHSIALMRGSFATALFQFIFVALWIYKFGHAEGYVLTNNTVPETCL
jgi:hypothetical protein